MHNSIETFFPGQSLLSRIVVDLLGVGVVDPKMGDRNEREPLLNGSSGQVNGNDGQGKQYIVRFDEDGDPDNPLEWSKKYRWFSVALLCLSAAVVYEPSLMMISFAS